MLFKKKFTLKSLIRELRRLLGELIGTFVLVFIHSLGPIAQEFSKGVSDHTATGVAGGFILIGLIYSLGQVSGAHFNPVVTLAFTLRRDFPVWRAPLYIAAQVAGSFIAAGILQDIFGELRYIGANYPDHGLSNKHAFGLEIIFTTILVFVILNVAERARVVGPNAALAVGFTLSALMLSGGELSGASMNPARSLGPAVLTGKPVIEDYWIYVAGPFVGGAIAVLLTYALGAHPNPKGRNAAAGQGTNREDTNVTKKPTSEVDPSAPK